MGEPMKNEELQIDVGENEEETTVEMNEDGTDAKVAEEEKPVVEEERSAPDSDDLDNYSEKVKKRIDKLTARLRETERREQSALEYAKSIKSRNEELQQQNQQTAKERVGETSGRIETQIIALKNVIKRAREEGDIDTETEAQQRLTTTVWEQQQLKQELQTPQQQTAAPVQPPPEALNAPSASRPPDPKAEEWAKKNPWFGEDIVMTNTVRGIHVELIKNEGFDPSADEYYDEIDRRMKNLFPKQYNGDNAADSAPDNRTNRPVQTVAPATRSSGINNSARRTIKLKPSEVAIAKRLGVPLEEYAKHVKR